LGLHLARISDHGFGCFTFGVSVSLRDHGVDYQPVAVLDQRVAHEAQFAGCLALAIQATVRVGAGLVCFVAARLAVEIAAVIKAPIVRDAVMELLKSRDGLALGICDGFQALIKTGLVPYGEIRDVDASAPTLFHNRIARHISRYAHTRVASVKSPWLARMEVGQTHTIPLSHGEGRFTAPASVIADLVKNGQVAFQYCDAAGAPSNRIEFNPNGSFEAVEGITSPCGRVLGKMGHSHSNDEFGDINFFAWSFFK
jgi:phosphoribosylformylglycinamidine (FGAM) synthase-like amidotransferase family enzyme